MDEETRLVARELVGRLREPVQETRGAGWYLIEAALNEFSLSYRMYSEWEIPMPCLRDEAASPLPVDPLGFSAIAGPNMDRKAAERTQEIAANILRRVGEESGLEYQEHPPDAVGTFVEDRLTDFLSVAGEGDPGTGLDGPPNSLPFVVDSQTPGLALHCAPMFLLGRMSYFNAPTTPVSGWLSPGLWKFGAIGPGRSMVLDPGVFDAKLGRAMLTAI